MSGVNFPWDQREGALRIARQTHFGPFRQHDLERPECVEIRMQDDVRAGS